MSESEAPKPLKSQFPYADTVASIALKGALDTSRGKRGKSLRAVARELNYKQPVVLSHMAHGRIPVPIERAEEIAIAVGLDPKLFVKMALAQRYPDLDVESLSDDTVRLGVIDTFPANELGQVHEQHLTDGQRRVIREVIRDGSAAERWLTPHEVAVIALIRQLRPSVSVDGLHPQDVENIRKGLA